MIDVAWDTWESRMQEARREVARALGIEPGVTLEPPFGEVEIRLPGGRRRLRGNLRTGLWRLVEDEVALSDEVPLAAILERLDVGVHG
ncbi:hypothetical protein [Oceanithermus profundus]|uniref:hypothetical protein n=1 Tax=Oceanithermus profundus TaxID=187137 RepID=UPI00030A4DAA|nr:hypothetical protein [Oceanithermus profundus]